MIYIKSIIYNVYANRCINNDAQNRGRISELLIRNNWG